MVMIWTKAGLLEPSSNYGLGTHKRQAKPGVSSLHLSIASAQPSALYHQCLVLGTIMKGRSREEKKSHRWTVEVNEMCKLENSLNS